MLKKQRKILIFIIFLMMTCFVALIWLSCEQIGFQKRQRQHVDYTYKDFAANNKAVTDGVIILAYHRILKNSVTTSVAQKVSQNPQLHEYNVNEPEFVKQMAWLKKNSSVWSMTTFLKKVQDNDIKGKHVVVTFDDIDTTLPRNVAPVMNDKKIPYTMFVITGKVGQNMDGEQMASWQQLNQLAKNPLVDVGLHTHKLHYQENNQPILSTSHISKQRMIADYKKSYQTLQKKMQVKPTVFAYPYGSKNKSLTHYMAGHGMQGIFLLEPGIITNDLANIKKGIPRFIVTNSNFNALQLWLEN
ncbi:polysaccharide deacetylase family protein [Leuconostoc sp. MS02]|uniref:Polysaccharide deacetylase family protein n=1 Tax=Leuconostoc aquikimchii TaxID=3236804 RepID=A0ABV3S3M3_9LACO